MNLIKYGKRSIVLNYRIFLSLRYFKIVILSIFFTGISTSSIYAETVSIHQLDVSKQKPVHEKIEKEILAKGRSQWQKGELEKALLTLEEAVKIDSSNKQIAKVFKSMQLQKKRIDELLRKAFDFIEKNDYQNAKKSLKRASFISDKYLKYKKVFKKFIETKDKVADKVTNDRQKRTVSLTTPSKNFQVTNDIGKPFVQLGHSSIIDSVAITPDGKYLLSGSWDNILKLWNLKTGKEVRTFVGHTGTMTLSTAITPDGKYALSGTNDNILKLWNLKTGKEVRIFEEHKSWVDSVAITPDGRNAFSGLLGGTLKLWNLKTGKAIRTFVGHTDRVKSVAITPHGKYALSGSDDKTLKLWNLKTGKEIRTFVGHTDRVTSVAITPDGKYALSGSSDKTLKLWNLKTGKELQTFEGHTDSIETVAITPDGKYALSGSWDNILKLWNLKTGKAIRTFEGHTGPIGSVAITPDGKYALSGSWDITMNLWNLKTGKIIRTFVGYGDSTSSIVIHPDGKYALSGLLGGTLKLWNLKTGKAIQTFEGHRGSIYTVVITPNGKQALTGSSDKTLKLWNLKTGKEIRTFEGHTGYIETVAITPDGKYALSGSWDKTLKLWNLKTGKEIRTFEGHTDRVNSVAITPDGRYALSGSWDNTLKLWNLKTGKAIQIFEGHRGSIYTVVITPNGKQALFGSSDGTLKLLNLKTGKEIRSFEGHISVVDSVAITPDGKYALSGSWDKTLKLWNLKTGKEIRTFEGHISVVDSVSITPDGRYALSGSWDNTLKLWNLKTGKELLTTISFTDGEWLSMTPEGYFNASENGAKHLNVLTGPMSVTSVDAYYETFYRPDIVKAALAGKSIDTGLAMRDIKPAPEVEIIHTPSQIKSDEVKVTLSIKDIGGGVGDIRLYLNGVAVKIDSRPIVGKQKNKTIQKSYTLKLPKGKNSIKALVFNQGNTMQSNDAMHTITANYKIIHKPEIHALVIGIDTYKNPKLQLKYAASDATLFADTIESQSKGLFSKIFIYKLDTKENTSKEAITQKLKELQSLNPDDLFVFYVASHGTVDDGEYFLITSNVGSTSTRKLKSDAIKQVDLKRLIANVPTTKKLIVLDTCNAGAMGSALLTRGMSEDTAMKILSRAVGSTILSAATSQQQALEGYKEHGLFTYVLTEGLKGKADSDNDGYVKTLELANYIDDEVPQLAEKLFNRAQYPVVSPSGQAFPVGKVK